MLKSRPISDHTIIIICRTIGLFSLLLNVVGLYLARKMWHYSSKQIVVVSLLLQILYTIQNFHFTILYIPFLYIRVGGGYCIGSLCEPHYVSFTANLVICIVLVVNLWGLFILLLFYRHQSLLRPTSRVKLSSFGSKVITICLISGINILPFRHAYAYYTASPLDLNQTLDYFCQPCDWIDQDRNFAVIPFEDAVINGCIVVVTCTVYMTFALACTVHIIKIINDYDKLRSSGNFTAKVSRTKQSLVQIATFATVLALPIALFMSLAVFKFDDDSIVLLPCIFLFSLNSLSHSTLTIIHSPFVKSHLRDKITVEKTSFNTKKVSTAAAPAFNTLR